MKKKIAATSRLPINPTSPNSLPKSAVTMPIAAIVIRIPNANSADKENTRGRLTFS